MNIYLSIYKYKKKEGLNMDYKALQQQIVRDTKVNVYNKKLLKAVADYISPSDSILSAFVCNNQENNTCLLVATDSKLFLCEDAFFKKPQVDIYSFDTIQNVRYNQAFLNKSLIIYTQNSQITLSKISNTKQIKQLIAYI